ncbi:glycosyl hydrolase [Mucilaginibacter humi]|uniref:glycosyl hydrolase n=1 Tax=Mucilaginibacter humi TaxID=2732510 RepID=UPI001C2F012A|nr:glycosyl hydrolase [Mucilaginibacter humi]
MSEFWSKGYGFNSSFSTVEATSIAHVNGRSLTPAEAFTAHGEDWRQHPGSMKNRGDWAFAAGVNRFVYHTFQNQFLNDTLRPGATMGPYGVHWDRNQTTVANGSQLPPIYYPVQLRFTTRKYCCRYFILKSGRLTACFPPAIFGING